MLMQVTTKGRIRSRHHASASSPSLELLLEKNSRPELLFKIPLLCSTTPQLYTTYTPQLYTIQGAPCVAYEVASCPPWITINVLCAPCRRIFCEIPTSRKKPVERCPYQRQQIIVLAYRTVDRWRPWGDSSGCHIKGLPAMGMVTSTYTATVLHCHCYTATILLLPTFFCRY